MWVAVAVATGVYGDTGASVLDSAGVQDVLDEELDVVHVVEVLVVEVIDVCAAIDGVFDAELDVL